MSVSMNNIQVGAFIFRDGPFGNWEIRHIIRIKPPVVNSGRRGRGDHLCTVEKFTHISDQTTQSSGCGAVRKMAEWATRMATEDEIRQLGFTNTSG